MVTDKFGVDVTEDRWSNVDLCIKRFVLRYPRHWEAFLRDLADNRTEYGLALEKGSELRKAGWRNTASFPVVYRKATEDDGLTGKEDDDLVQVESLLDDLKDILPGLVEADDRKGKTNKLYREFLKRYPYFQVGEKR